MGIQDAIYDLEDALNENCEEGDCENLDRLVEYISDLERQVEQQNLILNDLRRGLGALKLLQSVD